MRRRLVLAFLCALAGLAIDSIAAESGLRFPELRSLGPEDSLYLQQQSQVEAAYMAESAAVKDPDLVLYSYRPPANSDLFALAARLSLPIETLATVNRIDRSRAFSGNERLIVPSVPGIFVPLKPSSDLELLISYRGTTGAVKVDLGSITMWFYPGARFSQEERSLFLGRLFRFPLPHAVLTSGFGDRVSPITGRWSMHPGVDLAAPYGTEVYAARDGKVIFSGFDPVLGQHIIIEHTGGWSTVYGHLSVRFVRLNQEVDSGMIIGRVGSTGESTGPHLHFEVRNHGEAQDPTTLVPRIGQ
ncbi:MAG TPA: M23 family metallopeptidase [Rectinemataceae bacterium]|nr:M23 family metallopeptidase [Rectinemataceae bacterium]